MAILLPMWKMNPSRTGSCLSHLILSFETGSYSIAQDNLDLTMEHRLAPNSRQSYLSFQYAGIAGVSSHT